MRLVATQELTYDAKMLNVGDEFDAPDKDAELLKGVGKARDTDEQKTDAPRTKRQYKRRDMRAENSLNLKPEGGGE